MQGTGNPMCAVRRAPSSGSCVKGDRPSAPNLAASDVDDEFEVLGRQCRHYAEGPGQWDKIGAISSTRGEAMAAPASAGWLGKAE